MGKELVVFLAGVTLVHYRECGVGNGRSVFRAILDVTSSYAIPPGRPRLDSRLSCILSCRFLRNRMV